MSHSNLHSFVCLVVQTIGEGGIGPFFLPRGDLKVLRIPGRPNEWNKLFIQWTSAPQDLLIQYNFGTHPNLPDTRAYPPLLGVTPMAGVDWYIAVLGLDNQVASLFASYQRAFNLSFLLFLLLSSD